MADISDILASVSRPSHLDPSTQEPEADAQSDLRQLTRAFISERTSPELLPYPSALMDRMSERIRAQIARIEDSTSAMQTGSSFTLVVLQTELERIKWLIRSFLRARLSKIDQHTPFLLSQIDSSSTSQSQSRLQSQSQSQIQTPLHDSANPLMSRTEHAYALRHNALLEQHYARTFLSAFPSKLQRLDDRVGGGAGAAMIQGPDLESVVFVRCLGVPRDKAANGGRRRFEGNDLDSDDGRVVDEYAKEESAFAPVEVSCGYTPGPGQGLAKNIDVDMDGSSQRRGTRPQRHVTGERMVSMQRGEIWAVRWSSVREAVARGEAELL